MLIINWPFEAAVFKLWHLSPRAICH